MPKFLKLSCVATLSYSLIGMVVTIKYFCKFSNRFHSLLDIEGSPACYVFNEVLMQKFQQNFKAELLDSFH